METCNKLHFYLILCWSAFLLFMLACLSGCKPDQSDASNIPSENRYIVARNVTGVSTRDRIIVSGFLEADKTVPLSFLVAGKVDCVYVDEGDHIKQGQALAKVEVNDYRSNLEIAVAKLFEAQDSYDRLLPLFKGGAISEKDLIKTKAGLMQAVASKDIAKKKVKDTKLLSPIPGIIGLKNVELGQTISTGVPVFTIVKTDKIYARVSVPESEIGKVALGQKAMVTIKALENLTAPGRVSLIGAVAEPRTRTYKVKIEIFNPDYVLRTGMIAKAEIITDRIIKMVTVPGEAIVRDADNLTYVFLVNDDKNTALRRRVFPGSIYKNEIEIKEGLEPEDIVIVAGQHKISDGSKITVTRPVDKKETAAVTNQES
jgi:membrane fusion protein, multidrug efflux system